MTLYEEWVPKSDTKHSPNPSQVNLNSQTTDKLPLVLLPDRTYLAFHYNNQKKSEAKNKTVWKDQTNIRFRLGTDMLQL